MLTQLPHSLSSTPQANTRQLLPALGQSQLVQSAAGEPCYTPKPDHCPPKSSQPASFHPFPDLFTKNFYQKFSSHRVGDTPCSPSSKRADPSGGCWVGGTVSKLLSLRKYLNSTFYFSCHISFIGSNFHLIAIIYTLF